MALVVKNPYANAGDIRDPGLIPDRKFPGGVGKATHPSILAWRIPWTGESGVLQVHRVTKNHTNNQWLSTHELKISPSSYLFCLQKNLFLYLCPAFLRILESEILVSFLQYCMASWLVFLYPVHPLLFVNNCEMSWILYLLQASKLVCHSFLDVDRRQEAPGSETKEFFSFLFFFYLQQCRQHSVSIPISSVWFLSHSEAMWRASCVHRVCITMEEFWI